jgi:spermidine synthase
LPDGLRFLSVNNVAQLFVFPTDMLPVPAEPNRLNDQVLVRYYEHEWRQIAR